MPTIHLRRRLVELDAQILEQKRVLLDLRRTRIALEREINETAMYPILTLPVEITTEIFHQLPLKIGLGFYMYRNTAPVSLTAVCRSWRAIALGTPELWSTLKITFDHLPSTVTATPGLVEFFIDQWFSRAGACPLSLTLSLPLSEDADDDSFPLSRMRDVVHRYSHRLRYLELNLGDNGDDLGELELHASSFPLLQAASFRCDESGTETQVFGDAPQLRSLHIGGYGVIPASFHLPWQQLTTFEGSIDNLDLFIVAPNLIDVKCDWTGDDSNPRIITHSCITSFAVADTISDEILQYLTLPSLKHLDLSKSDTYDFLESFIERSSPPLISLQVWAADPAFTQWHKALVHVAATLENIEISYASQEVMASTLSLWERPWASSPWRTLSALSNLKTLHFSHVPDPMSQDQLVHFLYSRSDKLRSFQLVWDANPFFNQQIQAGAPGAPNTVDTIAGHFSRLRTAGMDIYVGTEDKNYAAKHDDAANV
ncbi:hypothetical protein C8F04DRAFT_1069818 [Mycena alexandri]|uniref:F-box domain-containing protein n=1 Tax=Mycena alexandri TaxID=1745969 RepID=A0AAD6TJ91_9AGAR|nr:hypothetical protein C8F04DRAFT_1069818 [Mycena alexandri]